MLAGSAHLTTAVALEDSAVIEIDRSDITALLERKPMAGLDMLTMVGKQFRAAQELVRLRAARNPNEEIAEAGDVRRLAGRPVARFGGSWRFIGSFAAVLVVWVALNVLIRNPGTRIPTSCSTCSSPCSPPSRRRSS